MSEKVKAATNDQIKTWKQRQATYENDSGGSALPAQSTTAALSVSSLILRIEQEQAKWWECDGCGFEMHKQHVTDGMGCPCCGTDQDPHAECGVDAARQLGEITRLRGLLGEIFPTLQYVIGDRSVSKPDVAAVSLWLRAVAIEADTGEGDAKVGVDWDGTALVRIEAEQGGSHE